MIAASIFNSGILATPRPGEEATFDYVTAAPETLGRAHRIADVCEAHGVTLPQVAMAFPRLHPAVAGIVVGMRSPAQVRDNVEAFTAGIPGDLWSDLLDEGLLAEHAPVRA
ncbi:hypothetical protein GCM10022402_36230 [Salinactinospora qingdaonensis]|uniref:NADP-dependent oxidoreductase domain-containing protein n=1 Tax=Salinactinospora qingdaonensis TaxID=702744 RepID=A0ABP7G8Q4_9ACTN